MRDGVAICREIGGQRGETHREVQEARGWETQETRDTEVKRHERRHRYEHGPAERLTAPGSRVGFAERDAS